MITFTWGSPLVRPREESEKVTDFARGLVPKDEILDIIDRQKPTPHIVIQIKPGAYTEEEWSAMAQTFNGIQMAEPWDTIPGGES